MITRIYITVVVLSLHTSLIAQPILTGFSFSKDSLTIKDFIVANNTLPSSDQKDLPVVSFIMNGTLNQTGKSEKFDKKISVKISNIDTDAPGVLSASVIFNNISQDTIQIENVVPFGEDQRNTYITGKGKNGLSRTHLFMPGRMPVNVIVPDNAWELGFNTFNLSEGLQLTSLVRRNNKSLKKGSLARFETKLYPGGSITYNLYAEVVEGDWHTALQQIFQKRMLFDVGKFDNSLFERKDLQWVRHAYVNHLMMNWDNYYYDYATNKFNLDNFLQRGKRLYGGDDFISFWPTWPTLGLDQRNQFDLYRDLPGGTSKIKQLASLCRKKGTKLFVSYNPWDESTRSEDHFQGISRLIKATSADGMVLDTRGGSSKELQEAADKVRPGVVMYSEGMAVPKDMAGIVSGRVHNALYYAPMLNLNKLIKPEFAIFRVAELSKEPIQREFATSFFNGYGVEMNIMTPGKPDWTDKQHHYLGRTSRILRENTYNFVSHGFKPLIQTSVDSIWVNEWALPKKTIYTIYSIHPEGFNDYLFKVSPESGYHFVDLWRHRLLLPKKIKENWWIQSDTEAFHKKYLGTNNEGEVDCIARLPMLIEAKLNGDQLIITTSDQGDEIRIWAGSPDYNKQPLILKPGSHTILLHERFGRFEGDFIIQLMDKGILLDENIVGIVPGTPRRISGIVKTPKTGDTSGMAYIPTGKFLFKTSHGDDFISYPKQDEDSMFKMKAFYMDKFPVTNSQYFQFVKASKYKPTDTSNYLKHWINGKFPNGEENFPVVYVSYEDAIAYGKWAEKRLPTEVEWQYAAQTSAGNEWPWKQTAPVKRKEQFVTETLTVSALEGIDSSLCNLGDGKLYPVGKYPKGANPYGLQDLTGCVWQLTNDLYMNGSYRYIMMKGGSFFKPSSSWWYVQGGPRELHYRQYLLRVSQGFERNATVGFRCVKDAK